MKPETLARRWQKQDDLQIDSAFEALLGAPNGRKFLWWLLTIGKVGRQPFSSDPQSTAFACGELNVGQQILARLVQTSPEGYITLMKEQADATRNRDAELERARSELDRDGPEYPDAGTDD